MSHIVSPREETGVSESCIRSTSMEHHVYTTDRGQPTRCKKSLFPIIGRALIDANTDQQQQQQNGNPQQQQKQQQNIEKSIDANHNSNNINNNNVETSRMSPCSAFILPQVSASFSIQPPTAKNHNTSFNGKEKQLYEQDTLNLSIKQHVSQRTPQFDNQSNIQHVSRRCVRIHNDSRGAFEPKSSYEPEDREVEQINSSHMHQIYHPQQPSYQPPPTYHPQRMNYHCYAPHQYYHPPYNYQYPYYHNYGNSNYYYHHDMNMGFMYHPYNSMPPPPQAQTFEYSRKRKYESTAESSGTKPDYYIYTDRPLSSMSDITTSPFPSHDEDDHGNEILIPMLEKITSPPPRKKLRIDTSPIDYNPVAKEPKIERFAAKAVSTFGWGDSNKGIRTVSPLKPKSPLKSDCPIEMTRKRESPNNSKIWRIKRFKTQDQETIDNNNMMSCPTLSEHGDVV